MGLLQHTILLLYCNSSHIFLFINGTYIAISRRERQIHPGYFSTAPRSVLPSSNNTFFFQSLGLVPIALEKQRLKVEIAHHQFE